jgi:ubiquinone/menaquinone biosynthesis C-methylase UbiE
VPAGRDVDAFEARASGYEHGRLGTMHHEIADRSLRLALSFGDVSLRVLDVGCGTGYLLRSMAARCPDTELFVGVDPAPSMVDVATNEATDPRLEFTVGVAERLPLADSTFDLVISTTSFDHWADQLGGLRECHRVLQPGGRLVLVDQISVLLLPTLVGSRRGKARTRARCDQLLRAAGFQQLSWNSVYAVIINGVTATT